jgi:hypothetical protein
MAKFGAPRLYGEAAYAEQREAYLLAGLTKTPYSRPLVYN